MKPRLRSGVLAGEVARICNMDYGSFDRAAAAVEVYKHMRTMFRDKRITAHQLAELGVMSRRLLVEVFEIPEDTIDALIAGAPGEQRMVAPNNPFSVTVCITTDSAEHAHEVIARRLGYDEDYGFDYTVEALFDLKEEA